MLGTWFKGIGLEDVHVDSEARVATGSFGQSVMFDGVSRPELPAVESAGENRWWEAFKVPVVSCTFAIRTATAVVGNPEEAWPIWDLRWQEAARQLLFDASEPLIICCEEPNLEVHASDRIVGYRRLKRWRVLGGESDSPWRDE